MTYKIEVRGKPTTSIQHDKINAVKKLLVILGITDYDNVSEESMNDLEEWFHPRKGTFGNITHNFSREAIRGHNVILNPMSLTYGDMKKLRKTVGG